MKWEKSVGAVIFRKNKGIKYLLLYYDSGHWDYVKGHVEKGEEEIGTLFRETMEETGIKDLKLVEGFKEKIHYFHRRGKELISKDVVFYLAETKAKKIKLSFEHKDCSWLSYDAALERLTYKNAKGVLKKADKFLRRKSRKKKTARKKS